MAINNMQRPPLRHLATYVSSGNFQVPAGVNRLYATVDGSTAVNTSSPAGPPGPAGRGSGYVEVVPGGQVQVIVGAGGTSTTGSGGTTSFDGGIIVTSSSGGGYQGHEGNYHTGAAGSVTFASSLPSGAPAGATVKVTGTSSTTTSPGGGSPGRVYIYG